MGEKSLRSLGSPGRACNSATAELHPVSLDRPLEHVAGLGEGSCVAVVEDLLTTTAQRTGSEQFSTAFFYWQPSSSWGSPPYCYSSPGSAPLHVWPFCSAGILTRRQGSDRGVLGSRLIGGTEREPVALPLISRQKTTSYANNASSLRMSATAATTLADGTPVPMAAVMVGTTGLAAVLMLSARRGLSAFSYA